MAKHTKINVDQLIEDANALYMTLKTENDLAAILIGTSFVDAALRTLLAIKFVDGNTSNRLLAHTGAVGTMSARADLCYALTLIDKRNFQEATHLSNIRNIVAHHHLLQTFENPEIVALCEKLQLEPWEGHPEGTRARERFEKSATFLSTSLLVSAKVLANQPKATAKPEPVIKARGETVEQKLLREARERQRRV